MTADLGLCHVLQDGIFVPLPSKFGFTKKHADWMYGFSALWDPLREELRFLFDSLESKARAIDRVLLLQHATDKHVEEAIELHGCRLEIISDPVGREMQHEAKFRVEGDPLEFLEGWQLTCPRIRHSFQQGLLVFDGSKFTSFEIETIETVRLGKAAACVGPLYTQRRLIRPFVLYSARLGIERFDIYHTLFSNFTMANPYLSGIWPSSELSQHQPLVLFSHDRVRWHSYEAPPLRYYYGQTTALNDCIIRNRYLFEFVVISDPDELIRIKQGPSMDLATLLDQHFPPQFSSLAIPRYIFPVQCCQRRLGDESQDNADSSIEFFDSCKLHIMKDHDFGKNIVRPDLVEAVSQHVTILHRRSVQGQTFLEPDVAHLMHVKSDVGWGIPMDCNLGHEGFSSD